MFQQSFSFRLLSDILSYHTVPVSTSTVINKDLRLFYDEMHCINPCFTYLHSYLLKDV